HFHWEVALASGSWPLTLDSFRRLLDQGDFVGGEGVELVDEPVDFGVGVFDLALEGGSLVVDFSQSMGRQEPRDAATKFFQFCRSRLALPDGEHRPAEAAQLTLISLIASGVAL